MSASIVRESELDSIVGSFESMLGNGGDSHSIDLADFLPPENHPEFGAILVELIRIDIEYGWTNGNPKSVATYLDRFPVILKDLKGVEAVCFEEYRQKLQSGKIANALDYRERYGIRIDDWPSSSRSVHGARSEKMLEASQRGDFPSVGEVFLDFELVRELGHGSFARVYLAKQGDLSNRFVALKIARHRFSDAKMLARLQHTHIVPIYSVHREAEFEAICMPYFGAHTIGDLLGNVRSLAALPASGRIVFDTVSNKQEKTLRNVSELGNDVDFGQTERLSHACDALTSGFREFSELTYVEAVLLIGKKVASGLAHAHERGIVHRDLKPANILLADDGEPMILDFNLSQDLIQGTSASQEFIGGTLPYMAPEQLQAFRKQVPSGDPRSDIYSLGILLYELLSGTTPHPVRQGLLHEILDQSLQDRLQSPPRISNRFRAISPAVESMVYKCLAPIPEDRYQSAQELVEDIECQFENRPLRHAQEPSWLERSRKWLRRHPRVTSMSGIVTVACSLLLAMATLLATRGERLASLQSQAKWGDFEERLQYAQVQITDAPLVESKTLEKAIEACDSALQVFHIPGDSRWQSSTLVSHLSLRQQEKLKQDVAELYFMRATIDGLIADSKKLPEDQRKHSASALTSNERARFYHSGVSFHKSLDRQSRWLRHALKPEDLEPSSSQVAEASFVSTRELCQQACLLASQHRFNEAAGLWQRASMQDPKNIWVWYGLGYSLEQSKRFARAAECYSACVALNPEYFGWYFNRGRVRMKTSDYSFARDDFARAFELNPKHAESQVNLAIASLELNEFEQAVLSIRKAIELGFVDSQAYSILSQAYSGKGDMAAAKETRLKAERCLPTSAASWVGRGVSRAKAEPLEALSDFDEALAINAFTLAAYESKANVLAELLGRTPHAIEVLDRAIELFPEEPTMHACRGVLHARLNHRQLALSDANRALALDQACEVQYQVAGIFALLATDSPEDGQRAVNLLSESLRRGYGHKLLDSDPDLAPIRELSQYKQLQEAVHTLESKSLE